MNTACLKRGRQDVRRLRLLLFWLALWVALGSAATVWAAEEAPVRVAVMNYPNFLQAREDRAVGGYAYEYLKTVQQYTGWQYEFIEMNFADASQALEQGEIDLIAGNQYTPDRARLYDYSARSMGEGGSVLCVMTDDMRYCYNDYASYGGMRIAALKGSVRLEQTREKLKQYGVEAQFLCFDTDEEAKAALERGDADAALMSTIRCESKYKILARINSMPMYFCTSKSRPELKSQLDQAVEAIHLETPYYEERLDQKYYGGVSVQLAFTQEEKEYIAAAKPIAVAASEDLAPVEYRDEQTGAYLGVVPDSFRLMEQYSGLTFRFVPRPDTRKLREEMEKGQVQLIASVANVDAIAEEWGVTLSDPYYDNSVSLVIHDDVRDYKSRDCRVVLRMGYPYFERLVRLEGYTNLLYADSFTECVAMVNAKKADLTLIPSDCADSAIHRRSYQGVSTYLMPGTFMEYAIGVGEKTDPLLLSILNKSLAAITREQRTELLVQNLTTINEAFSLQRFLTRHRDGILTAALAAATIILLGTLYVALSRQRLNRRLQAALRKADMESRAKTDFLARMSHDMRTPMNGILGLSYLMDEKTDEPEMKKDIRQLRESGEYLLQLINDVLDVNKAESGHIELHPAVCDQQRLFASIVALVAPQMAKKGIDFHFDAENVRWRRVVLDEQRVKQIFVNLLNNAMKFTPEGGRIDFVMELITEDENRVRNQFVVRDTGAGISEDFLTKIFEPFAQENRVPGVKEGTGLGLFIVKSLVTLMDGTITVKSRVNQGTEFTLSLDFPLAPAEEAAPSASSPPLLLPPGTKVLLCEDHPLNAQITIRLLKRQGTEVVWRENGRLGVETFAQAPPHTFDLILMDIRMPVMDGLEAARAIRALDLPEGKTIPIVAMTANAYEEDVQKSKEAGMNAHLAKPVVPSALYETIARLIGKPGTVEENGVEGGQRQ